MESSPKILEFFRHLDGRCPTEDWIDSLSFDVQGIITRRLDRLEKGNYGDCKPVGEGVTELKMDYGPGYRLFVGTLRNLVVILIGCDKSGQRRTIPIAKALWKEYKQRLA